MSKTLVLAEKPSVGRDIARVLNCTKKGNGFLEGDKYVVTWALGHLVTLADPETYDAKYANWRLEDLPMLPDSLKLVVIKQSGQQFKVVKSQMQRSDVGELIIATDAGREGELVARWIIAKANFRKPIKRLWISSVTDQAIRDGFRNLKAGRDYENLYASAVARAEADWLVGLNATRALTCKFNAQLSCGRVQTPTLAIIAAREKEIQNFKARTFYGLTAETDKIKFVWQDSKTKETRIYDNDKADQLLRILANKQAVVSQVDKSMKKSSAPALYNLTELQRDANRMYNFSAKETLNYMQNLYERHKLLTYPRTDSRYLSNDIVPTLPDRLKACGVGPYRAMAMKLSQGKITPHKSFVDDSKVSDHHAIIPTEQPATLSLLNENERKIYDLVVKRFMAVLYPSFEYEQTTITAKIGTETFVAKGKRVIAMGWKEVYGHYEDEDSLEAEIAEQLLPVVNKGDTLEVASLRKTEGKTKPPSPFSEGTLLAAMENPAKYMEQEDRGLIKTLGETGGLGTVATRADIIEKLFNTFLIEKKGKEIFITAKGKQLLELVPEELKSPALTAQWEQRLALIAKGSLGKELFVSEMRDYTKAIVKQIKNSTEVFKHDNLTGTKCPVCGKYMLEVTGKKGKMLICQDRECGQRIGLAKTTNARCPNCHKKLELRGEGEGQLFTCNCGYREKLSVFNERRKKEGAKVGKKDVANYLQKQKKAATEPMNTALSDALAKLKLEK